MIEHPEKTWDLHITQNEKQQNYTGFENDTFECIQKKNIPINREIDWETETKPMKSCHIIYCLMKC